MNPSVTLVTTFRPGGSGGAVIIDSLLAPLAKRGVDVRWVWFGPLARAEGERLGENLVGGPILRDAVRAARIWAPGRSAREVSQVVDELLSKTAAPYWVVGHYDGVLIARELATRGVPVHLSVHDDPAGGLARRSRRYLHLLPLVAARTFEALCVARTVDVVSEGMRRFYLQRFGVDSMVVHRWLPPHSSPSPELPPVRSPGRIDIGHIGSVYSLPDLTRLADAVARLRVEDQDARLMIIAPSREVEEQLNRRHANVVEFHKPMEEAEAARTLQGCTMLYAAYPFSRAYRTFRRTSLPTKVSTYVMARAPILAHTPNDSTLNHFVMSTGTGHVTTATNIASIGVAVRTLASSPPSPAAYDRARDMFFGDSGPDRLAVALSGLHA